MKKGRIKDFIKVVKTMEKNNSICDSLQIEKDTENGRVYFCNGHGVLSIPTALYNEMLETDPAAFKGVKECRKAGMFSKFITDFENGETVAGYKSPFLFNTGDHLCNIVKSIDSAGDAVFTVVNNVYFSLLETVAGYNYGLRVAKDDAQKKPVMTHDIETGSTIAFLPVFNPTLQETARAAFNL